MWNDLTKYQKAGLWDGLLYPPGSRVIAARSKKRPSAESDVLALAEYLKTNGPTVSVKIAADLGWSTSRLRNAGRSTKIRIAYKTSAESDRQVKIAMCAMTPGAMRPTSKRSATVLKMFDELFRKPPKTYDDLAASTGACATTIRNLANSRPKLFTVTYRMTTIRQVMPKCAVYDVPLS